MKGDQLVRMVPHKDSKANHGHSCVKGRFAWSYTNHQDRILKPMLRERITDPWREVSWDEAIGTNPTDAHPVFASRMKKRLRQGAKLIVIDPRRTDLVRSAHIAAQHHLPLLPGTNVAMLNALAHMIVTMGLFDEAHVRERCDTDAFADWAEFIRRPENSPETVAGYCGVAAEDIRAAARLYATGGTPRSFMGSA